MLFPTSWPLRSICPPPINHSQAVNWGSAFCTTHGQYHCKSHTKYTRLAMRHMWTLLLLHFTCVISSKASLSHPATLCPARTHDMPKSCSLCCLSSNSFHRLWRSASKSFTCISEKRAMSSPLLLSYRLATRSTCSWCRLRTLWQRHTCFKHEVCSIPVQQSYARS